MLCHLKNMYYVENKYSSTSSKMIYPMHDQTKNKMKLLGKILKSKSQSKTKLKAKPKTPLNISIS